MIRTRDGPLIREQGVHVPLSCGSRCPDQEAEPAVGSVCPGHPATTYRTDYSYETATAVGVDCARGLTGPHETRLLRTAN
jgi:hypothetical protein